MTGLSKQERAQMDAIGDMAASLTDEVATSVEILIAEIVTRPQVRKTFNAEDSTIDELAESIKAQGQLQEIIVRQQGDGYELIAGERRLRAMKQAGFETIRAFIRNVDDEEARRIQLAENVHRLNLEQKELAESLGRQFEECGRSLKVLAERTQKSKSWLSRLLALRDVSAEATPATARLMQGVSGDVVVITAVKKIEQEDPERAQELVDTLAATRGQQDAHAILKAERAAQRAKRAELRGKTKKPANPQAPRPDEMPKGLIGFLSACWDRFEAAGWDYAAFSDALAATHLKRLSAALREEFEDGRTHAEPEHAILQRLGVGQYANNTYARLRLAAFVAGIKGRSGAAFDLSEIMVASRRGR